MIKYEKTNNIKLSEAVIPTDKDIWPHPEAGLNILMHQLKDSGYPDEQALFGNVTVAGLKKALHSASAYIDYSLFILGELDPDE